MIKCKNNATCDFCDARCGAYYEEDDNSISYYKQFIFSDNSSKYCKITFYKTPHYDISNGKQIYYTITIPDEGE